MHPYTILPDSNFWKRAVAGKPIGLVDPMINQPSFVIKSDSKVATMGSCFAQHVSKLISNLGLNFLVTDSHLGNHEDGFGIFSARYGNVYTVRQAIQLIRILENDKIFDMEIWELEGKFIDSMRPNSTPKKFNTVLEVQEDRKLLKEAVIRMLDEMDVFVYTLGLTEGWLSNRSGQIFPVAPGVTGGKYDPSQHVKFNDDFISVKNQLVAFIKLVRERNDKCKIILTVSPVPLAATHGTKHVLVANQYSKSILRIVAEEVCSTFEEVFYFPSYEIVAGLAQPGKYFQPNLRDIYPRGINHAMRVFKRHFIDDESINFDLAEFNNAGRAQNPNSKVLCDENLIYNLKRET